MQTVGAKNGASWLRATFEPVHPSGEAFLLCSVCLVCTPPPWTGPKAQRSHCSHLLPPCSSRSVPPPELGLEAPGLPLDAYSSRPECQLSLYDYKFGRGAFAIRKRQEELRLAGRTMVVSGPVKANTNEKWGGPGGCKGGGVEGACALGACSPPALSASPAAHHPPPVFLSPPAADTWSLDPTKLQLLSAADAAAAFSGGQGGGAGGPQDVVAPVHPSKGGLTSTVVASHVAKALKIAEARGPLSFAGRHCVKTCRWLSYFNSLQLTSTLSVT